MTLEELQAVIGELKTKIDAQDGEIAALKTKNAEIITEKRKLQDKFKALDDARPPKTDDPPNSAELRKRIEEEVKGEITELRARLDKSESERNNLAIDTALNEALDKAGVAVPLRSAAKALLKSARKIELANGNVVCDGKVVTESVAEWSKSDEGKAFIPAPSNGGSAAPGGSSGSVSQKRSEMTPAEKGAYISKNGLEAFQKLPG